MGSALVEAIFNQFLWKIGFVLYSSSDAHQQPVFTRPLASCCPASDVHRVRINKQILPFGGMKDVAGSSRNICKVPRGTSSTDFDSVRRPELGNSIHEIINATS